MRGIVAFNTLGYIGLDGELPWDKSEDLQHFKELTMTSHKSNKEPKLLVGYNTSIKLPKLPGRLVIVDDRHSMYENMDEIDWVIGGAKTYEKYSKYIKEWHISVIDDKTVGDVKFPFSLLLGKINHYYKF